MGANINNQDKNGVPTLVHVCEESNENEDFCMELIRKGADVRLTDEVKEMNTQFFVKDFLLFLIENATYSIT